MLAIGWTLAGLVAGVALFFGGVFLLRAVGAILWIWIALGLGIGLAGSAGAALTLLRSSFSGW